MKNIVCAFIALFLFSVAAFAQTNKADIERRQKDPKTAEQAAKADVYIIKSKTSIDSVGKNQTTVPATEQNKLRKKSRQHKKNKKVSRL